MIKNNKQGFSVVEILVSMGILAIVLWAVANFQAGVFTQNNFIRSSLNADSEVRSAIKQMIKEIRGATQSDTGGYLISSATKNSLTFFSDIDGSGLRSQVRYYLSGTTTLMRGVIKPTGSPLAYVAGNEKLSTLVKNVANTNQEVFYYYDQGYTGSESALTYPINVASVRLIKIVITADENTNLPPPPITMESQVAIRSLKK